MIGHVEPARDGGDGWPTTPAKVALLLNAYTGHDRLVTALLEEQVRRALASAQVFLGHLVNDCPGESSHVASSMRPAGLRLKEQSGDGRRDCCSCARCSGVRG